MPKDKSQIDLDLSQHDSHSTTKEPVETANHAMISTLYACNIELMKFERPKDCAVGK